MASWRRLTGVAGLAAGAAAAGAGALLAAEKIAVGRIRLRPDPDAEEPFGQLRGRPLTVLADDGVPLHAEIDGPDGAPVTIVFCHGYTLSQDTWHYQRRDLAKVARLVFWDQRGHGRSGRSAPEHANIDQLGTDLHTVLAATCPGDGPVVLAGHSMGGMTIMALAEKYPGLFGTKVAGVALISTAVSQIDPTIWLPGPLRAVARRAAWPVLRGAASQRGHGLVERGRSAASDLSFLSTRLMAFGDPEISPTVVDFLERIIRSTPIEVVADFYPALVKHDKLTALLALGRVPVVVVTGDRDRLVPLWQAEYLAAEIPGAELRTVPGAGHVIILEQPRLINNVLTDLVAQAEAVSTPHGKPGLAMPVPEQATGLRLRVPTGDRMRELGERLARLLRAGDLVVLAGPLGAGKTTLVQGIGAGLGVRGPVTSPTFVIARVHPSSRGGPDLVHADAYRLGSRAEVDDLDLDADLDRSVTVVEWGEGLVEGLTPDCLHVTITVPVPEGPAPGDGDEPRIVGLAGTGDRWAAASPRLRQEFSGWD